MTRDPRTCPHCGHPIIDWDVRCPGCDAIPWETPEGKRMLARRRLGVVLRLTLVLGFIALGLGLILRATHRVHQSENAAVLRHLDEVSGRVLYFQYQSGQDYGEAERKELRDHLRGWLDLEAPMLLDMLRDHQNDELVRLRVITVFQALLRGDGSLQRLLPEEHEKLRAQIAQLRERLANEDLQRLMDFAFGLK